MKRDKKILDNKELSKKVAVIVGTRPGIIMFAPIIHGMRNRGLPYFVIHTGQHYSANMDADFFKDLELPEPDHKLGNISEHKTHGAQTAAMLVGIEEILLKEKPRLVLVGGDANTNLSGALAARKLRIAVGHIEAGERSYDWRMPEEHNRRIIDHISEHLFTTGEKGKHQLEKEAVQGKIHITGNPIVDASKQHLEIAKLKSDALIRFNLSAENYAILTTHREENVDFPDLLRNLLQGVSKASEQLGIPVLFPAHPRTQKRLHEFGLWEWANQLEGIIMCDAVGYLDFLNLIAHAKLVFTDSGGVQQEACIHHIPSVTLRENTEWVETIEIGANRLAGTDPERIKAAAKDAFLSKREWSVPFGDGDAAENIINISKSVLEN